MLWNWQQPDWPKFYYNPDAIAKQEREFLVGFGSVHAFLKHVNQQVYSQFMVEILSMEAQESSRIEGEILDRESLQSSIKKHFGLQVVNPRLRKKESNMAELLCTGVRTFFFQHSRDLTSFGQAAPRICVLGEELKFTDWSPQHSQKALLFRGESSLSIKKAQSILDDVRPMMNDIESGYRWGKP